MKKKLYMSIVIEKKHRCVKESREDRVWQRQDWSS